MVRRLTYGAVITWVSLGTLLTVYTSVMAVLDPKLHFGLGIVQLMGARALLASLPLAVCGLAGLWLLARHRTRGLYLLGVFSLTWTVTLGIDQLKDFDPVIAGMAALYLLAALWSIWTARHWRVGRSRRVSAASTGSESGA